MFDLFFCLYSRKHKPPLCHPSGKKQFLNQESITENQIVGFYRSLHGAELNFSPLTVFIHKSLTTGDLQTASFVDFFSSFS